MIVRATQKILLTNQLTPVKITEDSINNLNEWYVNYANSGFRGKTLMLFVHAKSLLTIITVGKSLQKTHPLFLKRLEELMKRSHFPVALSKQILEENNHVSSVAKTASKSILAKINQITLDVEAHCAQAETFEEVDFTLLENYLLDTMHGTGRKILFSPEDWWNYYIQGEDASSDTSASRHSLQRIIKSSRLNRDGLTKEEELHMENQMLRMDLEQKFGKPINLHVKSEEGPELPPHLENQFLKHMNVFEQQIRHAKEITIYEAIERPSIKAPETLHGAKLTKEIERIFKLLAKHNILVDFLAEYSPEEVYRFLAIELMEKKIPDIHVPGFITHLVYEEFHPNHPYNIALLIRKFMQTFFDEGADEDELTHFFTGQKHLILNGQTTEISELLSIVKTFHLTGKSERIIGYDLVEIDINEALMKARVEGAIVYKNEIKGKKRQKSTFVLYLEHQQYEWMITKIDFDDWNS